MRDVYKNHALYYVLVPIAVSLWPLLVRGVYLPKTQEQWESEKARYLRAQEIMEEILTLDRDRLDLTGPEDTVAEFDYAGAADRVARLYDISYTVTSRPIRTSGGQKTKNANVILRNVNITDFALFLTTIQFRWPNLECERITLLEKKGLRDRWDVTLEFKYYY